VIHTPLTRRDKGWGSKGILHLNLDGFIFEDMSNSSWWDCSNCHSYLPFTITNNDGKMLHQNYTANLTIDPSVFVDMASDGSSIYLIINNDTEIYRTNVTSWTADPTDIFFKLQTNISASGTNDSYALYNCSGLAAPKSDPDEVFSKISNICAEQEDGQCLLAYNMDEGIGNLTDISGKGFHLPNAGDAITDMSYGRDAGSIDNQSQNDYGEKNDVLILSDGDAINFDNANYLWNASAQTTNWYDFTIMFWMNFSQRVNGARDEIVSFGQYSGTYNMMRFLWNDDNTFYFQNYVALNDNVVMTFAGPDTHNEWQFFAITKNISAQAYQLYINGVNKTGMTGTEAGSPWTHWIGTAGTGLGGGFGQGVNINVMDDFVAINRSLTQEEIYHNYWRRGFYVETEPSIVNGSIEYAPPSPNNPPVITLNNPTNNTYLNMTSIDFKFIPRDYDSTGYTNCSVWYNDTGTYGLGTINTSVIQNNSVNTIANTFTGDEDLVMIWNVECCDTNNDCNFNVSNRTLILDTVAPQLLNELVNETPMYNEQFEMNVTYNDINYDSYRFAWNITGTMSNESIQQLSAQVVNLTASKQNTLKSFHQICWEFWANDTAGNEILSTQYCFEVMNTPPTNAIVLTPSNSQSLSYVNINYTADESEGDALTFYVYINDTFNSSSASNLTNWGAGVADAHYSVVVSAYDGNFSANSTMVNFSFDNTAPVLYGAIINKTPSLNEQFHMNISADEVFPDVSRLAWNISGAFVNDSVSAYSGTPPINISTEKQNTLARGNYICWKYWANDTSGNEVWSSESCFTVGNSAPSNVIILSPTSGVNRSYIDINYTADDADIGDTLTFYVYINSTFNSSSTSNITNWVAGSDHYSVEVSAYDGTSFSANSSITNFTYDFDIPLLRVIEPIEMAYYNISDFSLIYVVEDTLSAVETCWYNLNDGTNTTQAGCANGTFKESGLTKLGI